MFNLGFANMSATFKNQYRCFSVSMMPGQERPDVAKGGKIIMPPSALDHLTRLNIQYPMLFKLTNKRSNRSTHAGVLEFVAEEGKVYFPYWMMKLLCLDEGDLVQIENVSLPVAKFAKFQPQSVDFLDITNPKAVLENALRSFACLTTGDTIEINYNEKAYELCILETKPGAAVTIIECDMDVDFAPPVGYQEPERIPKPMEDDEHMPPIDVCDTAQNKFKVFAGQGNRLDGKKKPIEQQPPIPQQHVEIKRGIPNYDYKKGTITFYRNFRFNEPNGVDKENKDSFAPFSGQGQILRTKKK